MFKRTLLIAAALAAPLAAFAIVAAGTPETPPPETKMLKSGSVSQAPDRLPSTAQKASPARKGNWPTLEEAREKLAVESERLDKLTPEEWDAEMKKREERRKKKKQAKKSTPSQ